MNEQHTSSVIGETTKAAGRRRRPGVLPTTAGLTAASLVLGVASLGADSGCETTSQGKGTSASQDKGATSGGTKTLRLGESRTMDAINRTNGQPLGKMKMHVAISAGGVITAEGTPHAGSSNGEWTTVDLGVGTGGDQSTRGGPVSVDCHKVLEKFPKSSQIRGDLSFSGNYNHLADVQRDFPLFLKKDCSLELQVPSGVGW